jgi:uncharacterized protein
MKRFLAWTLAAVVVLAAGALGARWYATRLMDTRAVTPKALGAATPASDSLPFARLAVPSGERTLIGWWVRASGDSATAPAVLFLHGNRSAISDYVPLLGFFHRQGISTMVFDYTGFGASGGSASLSGAVADAGIMARVFADSAGPVRRTAFGSALGATILLQAIDSIQPHVHGAVIEGVTASVREAAVRDGRIPRLVAPLLVDIADNVAAARRVRVPLLVIHSAADSRFPFSDAERVIGAVSGRAALVKHPRPGHSALLASSRPCDWQRFLRFVRTGELPAAKPDTADICAMELEARAADSLRRADSLRQALRAPGSVSRRGSRTWPDRFRCVLRRSSSAHSREFPSAAGSRYGSNPRRCRECAPSPAAAPEPPAPGRCYTRRMPGTRTRSGRTGATGR